MSTLPDVLWLNASPSLQGFDRPLLKFLSRHTSIAHWQYCQTQDEPTCLEVALELLHEYARDRPLHLLGHSTSGLLGLLYARRYPAQVKSLTLLSVGIHPAIDWQSHYYVLLKLLPCSRQTILTQMVYNLFGYQSKPIRQNLVRTLERDLTNSLSPHSLFQQASIAPASVSVPLFVTGSQDDMVVDPQQIEGWRRWGVGADFQISRSLDHNSVQPNRLWQCPSGRHFFHYFHPALVGEQILNFWTDLRAQSAEVPVSTMV
jgi:pimeloyl-ACP methyl ester carboxylesterase